ncbi:hypothetical protein R2325_09205 [Mycobacteroides chelonae]|nr:hypothetical protein [Mycobacteroides chelonae]
MADDSETEPGPAVASVTGMTARIGVREYFASELLWNANYLVEMAEAREAALLGEGFRGVDRVLRAQVVSSIFQSVAFLEAYANGVWGTPPLPIPPARHPYPN